MCWYGRSESYNLMKKGIHPLMRATRVVMRNGASFNLQTVMKRAAPYILQSDTTTHAAWTGEKAGLSVEDERIARLLKRFDGFVDSSGKPTEATKPEASESNVA